MPMPVLCLVGCCKTKRRHRAPAKELYCSPLFRLCRAWAEQHADAWAILSAHYGVVRPDMEIEPYDTTIAQRRPFGQPPLSRKDFGNWLYSHVQAWRSRYATPTEGPRLVILAGKPYWACLVGRLEFTVPLDGLGIGQRLRWLKQQTAPRQKQWASPPAAPSLFRDQPPF